MKRIALVIALFLAIVPAAPARPAALPVSTGLHPCSPTSPFYCGTIVRAVDPSGTIPGTIGIHFEWLPRGDQGAKSEGVIIANEGGPGSGSTESRASYRSLFAPLLDHRDMLLMDNRGTGDSRDIDCEPLQSTPVMKYPDIERCGAQLGHAAALYGTGLAADDLAAIMDAMHIRTADLYGDSYGTFFVQTFAGRHPHRVRSLILDGAYPVVGESPWYPEAPAAVRRAFNAVCRRAQACATFPGSSMDRIAELIASLRKQPASGMAPVGDRMRQVTVAATDLAFVMDASGLAVVPFRELDAAARADLDGDALPLLRLTGESYPVNESAGPAFYYSRGLFTAVSCADYPQAFGASEQEPARHEQWLEALDEKRAHDPDIYAPFSLDEWLDMPPDYSVLTLCLDWPVPLEAYPPGQPVPPGTVFPDVPVLVISGEIDTITPAAQGAKAAALFPHATQVVMANSAHVDAMEDPFDCASRIALRFIATLQTGDTSCAGVLPELRTVPQFVRHARDLAPADPLPGNQGREPQLRATAAAVQTVGDSLARTLWDPGPKVLGLRGGSFTFAFAGNAYDLQLDGVRWTEDLAVTGTARSVFGTGAVESRIAIHGVSNGTLFIRWKAYDRHAIATATGTVDGETVRATLPAP
ncbi:MAG TPA: alpha/beta fold hydrolase [Candidatus Eremiobacteraceae bacterium]